MKAIFRGREVEVSDYFKPTHSVVYVRYPGSEWILVGVKELTFV